MEVKTSFIEAIYQLDDVDMVVYLSRLSSTAGMAEV
jgi:hypothetical protein